MNGKSTKCKTSAPVWKAQPPHEGNHIQSYSNHDHCYCVLHKPLMRKASVALARYGISCAMKEIDHGGFE